MTPCKTRVSLVPIGWLAVLLLSACAGPLGAGGTDTARWDEEVKLHDGKVIVLERRATIGRSGYPVAHRGTIRDWEICYRPMNVYWKSGGVFKPEIFDIYQGFPYVMVPVPGCTSCQLYDYPDPSAMFFKHENNEWKRIPFSEFPKEFDSNLLSNVFHGVDRFEDVRGYTSLASKERRDGDPKWRGGTFRAWVGGQRGKRCEVCKSDRGQISGTDPAYEVLSVGQVGCP